MDAKRAPIETPWIPTPENLAATWKRIDRSILADLRAHCADMNLVTTGEHRPQTIRLDEFIVYARHAGKIPPANMTDYLHAWDLDGDGSLSPLNAGLAWPTSDMLAGLGSTHSVMKTSTRARITS